VNKVERRNVICAETVRLLSEERKRRKLSKNKVANLSGLNQSTVSRLENYHDNPTLDSLLRIADVLDINLGVILTQAIEKAKK
jgi:transcriptional regulator with XRE-family HTH domain